MDERTPDARVVRTRRDVGATAAAVLLARGWGAVTHAEVAREAGFSKATIYTHWPRQLDLLRLAVEVVCDTAGHPTLTGDPRVDVRASLTDFAHDLADGHLDRLVGGIIERSQEPEMQDLRRRVYDTGTASLREALLPAFEADDVEVALAVLTGSVFAWVSLAGHAPSSSFIDDLVDRVLGEE